MTLRAARVPSKLKSAWRRRDKDSDACARVLGEWLAGAFPDLEGRPLAEDDLGAIFGHDLDWSRIVEKPFAVWLAAANGDEMQAETPLTWDDLAFLREGPSDPLDLAWAIIAAQAAPLAHGLARHLPLDRRAHGDRDRVSQRWGRQQHSLLYRRPGYQRFTCGTLLALL